jgi:iron(II)-dependent oxidoreductase
MGMLNGREVAAWLADAAQRTRDLVGDFAGEQWLGPRLPIVNPPLWELGHLAWFQEYWILRHACGHAPMLDRGDALYDSAKVAHATRWDQPLPSPEETFDYSDAVRARAIEALDARGEDPELLYFAQLAVFHEDMHGEAFAYTRQTLAYPPPRLTTVAAPANAARSRDPLPGDVDVEGGEFRLGAEPGSGFVFDNEKWAHDVHVAPFRIARAPVTQAEYAAFVDDDGYARRELWSDAGWAWRESSGAEHPVWWRRRGGDFERRTFDRWVTLEPHQPVVHVNAFEASAWCRWAGRRLPTEAEWELAASCASGDSTRKRRFPWGDRAPEPEHARLDGGSLDCAEVGAYASGDSACGVRQMLGNVWEWTDSAFVPYPGFVRDPYAEYSEPWFGTHRVLRGGAWITRSRLLRNTWRNFYTPDRRDIWAGFRTCAVES